MISSGPAPFVLLTMISIGVIFYAFILPYVSGDAALEKRQEKINQSTKRKSAERIADPAKRRQQIVESIKNLEADNKKKKVSLENKLLQAGFQATVQKFYIISAAVGFGLAALVFLYNGNPLIALGGALIGGFGLPRWYLSFRIKRRLKKFLEEFPGAVDIIIRGIKAGLPLTQCVGIIAAEANQPVRAEFKRLMEAQAIGMSIGEAVTRLPDSVPLAEANFFAIVVSLQQKSGGNLSEALGNLSKVLRERKKMRQKITAMSSEARASAMIIGSLPFIVTGLVYLTSPDYIMLLFITMPGRIVVGCGLVWMSIGVFIMKRLVAFDF